MAQYNIFVPFLSQREWITAKLTDGPLLYVAGAETRYLV